MKQKKVFIVIFVSLALMLMIMPFTLSLNDAMTQQVVRLGWYVWIEKYVAPFWVELVGVVVRELGINFVAMGNEFSVNGNILMMSWNCLGWQSLVLFIVSIVIGFSAGKYTLASKLEATLFGLLGTFLMNLLRIVFTVILLVVSKPLYAIVFHDYLAAVSTVVWLIFFWWFSYKYILEEKRV